MSYSYSSKSKTKSMDQCSICLSALAPGTPLLILSCNHKYHFQCLMSSVQAQNNQCPLCRATIDQSMVQLLSANRNVQYHTPHSREDTIDETVNRSLSSQGSSREGAGASASAVHHSTIAIATKLEYKEQVSKRESNIYGLVTLQATSSRQSSTLSRVPIDLVCVVDQSASMSGVKMILLKETLIYITEQLTEYDRLAIISFDNCAYDRSHGLKRMNSQNKHRFHVAINDDIEDGFSTNIKCGLEMGINLFRHRQAKNPISALFLLTDGQDDEVQDYSQVMRRLPNDVVCHTFGYGSDHAAPLLVQLAEWGNSGTFTYIDKHEAVGPAFATALAGLLTCIAQNIRVNIQFNDGYRVTHVHSIYKYVPKDLPSPKITFKLNDLNADEKRNLIFQLHVPKLRHSSSSQNHTIGHVSIVYTDPNSNHTLTTPPVPFHLIRTSRPSSYHLQIDRTIDLQRNRIETVLVLRQAMEEQDYNQSMALLKAQVERIKASVSAQDPFCQQLIRDLEYRYTTEGDYRSTYHNIYMQHATERSTYSSASSSSAQIYSTINQLQQINNYERRSD
ncbi:hypothetical protein I4U23_015328 [Adineta vaga]|nr:hypothetical protein I4U23_015328 [Adineta vaga]